MKQGGAPRTVSCGVVILDGAGRVFLAHATDTTHWDIPKGQGEPGESPLQAALRELLEETGIAFAPGRLVDLGRFVYRHDKDLHLFAVRVADDEVDPARCVCTSLFPSRRDGTMIPEMDAYRWTEPGDIDTFASRSLARLFRTILPLADLHRRLPRA
ncbi:NUDIX hydrolase [Burkholderia stagnalis]|uniref:NUDIX hydrolase n=1 Tax=Burkholderia stagnalis TaxID=1503054 RepID=A0A119RZP8_9BURK|nr:NUDIX hydrolase [Burkholderia stagnalis]AOK52492.1 NUDIX hydrolase [Burkholderia stagnalis]KAB0635485.1 NUDIX hydrolase [Burkholderia stagnalis]KVC59543.1 NUDIX hydrolase [Burkholderia stagnalis]KVM81284.1 NUDIX hydrolase [Burkholderia stagnalis]KVM95457.1 NUDIX hydrolase [Burkholderia stagnalis]